MNNIIYVKKVLFAILCIFILSACYCKRNEIKNKNMEIGNKIPEFSVKMLDGKIIKSEDLKGTVNVIVFFNTMCGDCQNELPRIQETFNKFESNKNIRFVLISRAETKESVEEYWKEHHLSLPVSPQDNKEVYNKFAFDVIPRVYITNKENVIEYIHTDNPIAETKELISEIESLL